MNLRVLSLLFLPLVLAFAGCEAVGEALENAVAYEDGLERGRDDGKAGRSRSPQRYMYQFPEADRAEFSRGYEAGYKEAISGGGGASYGQPLRAVNGQGTVTIMEGSRRVSVCNTASPFIEETKFINEQEQIVVKSRGSRGPAMVQLFDTRNGREQQRVWAYDIRGGSPGWAAGMGE